jgi:hypothetical protein
MYCWKPKLVLLLPFDDGGIERWRRRRFLTFLLRRWEGVIRREEEKRRKRETILLSSRYTARTAKSHTGRYSYLDGQTLGEA